MTDPLFPVILSCRRPSSVYLAIHQALSSQVDRFASRPHRQPRQLLRSSNDSCATPSRNDPAELLRPRFRNISIRPLASRSSNSSGALFRLPPPSSRRLGARRTGPHSIHRLPAADRSSAPGRQSVDRARRPTDGSAGSVERSAAQTGCSVRARRARCAEQLSEIAQLADVGRTVRERAVHREIS